MNTHSGSISIPGTSRNTDMENQEPNEDRCQNDSRPEVSSSVYQSPHPIDSDPNETSYTDEEAKKRVFTI